MTAVALLMKEIETMPEEAAVEVLDFAMFIKGRHSGYLHPSQQMSVEPFANEKDATRFANDYAKRLLNGTW